MCQYTPQSTDRGGACVSMHAAQPTRSVGRVPQGSAVQAVRPATTPTAVLGTEGNLKPGTRI